MTARLIERLGYRFRDESLLRRALRHRSKGGENNERLEYLGDSVLSCVIANDLYDRFPDLSEGDLTRLRASLVRRETLSLIARQLDLGNYLELGGGELKSGGFDRDSILADALEAVIGAVFRDGGYPSARDLIVHLFAERLNTLDPNAVLKDPKTRLQEYLQARALDLPVYRLVDVSGDAHAQQFLVECVVPGLDKPVNGHGASRRYAEQDAAEQAYMLLSGG